MELKSLFTYHEKSRNLYKKFLKVFKLSVGSSSRDSIVFINKDTQLEIEFYFINHWIKYSIRYYNKNKDKMSYVYNYFWNRKDQTEFYFIGGDSDDIDYYITNYVNPHWFCVSLLKFCSVLCSREVADVIGTNYFIDKYDELDEEKKSAEKIILENIGGKYMFCINVLGNSTVKELEQLGYYCTTDNETLMIFEHKDNKAKIVIKQNNGNYTLNFENNNNEKFLKSDWYLGNNDGVCCVDIFTIMEKPEFKEFCKCEQQEVIDENEDTKQETLLTKFRKFEHIDKFIKSHTSFIITLDEPNIFIIHDGNYNMNIQVQVEENNIQVYVFDEKGEELGSETLGNINSLDNTIFNFAIFYERTYQDIRKKRFDTAMEHEEQCNQQFQDKKFLAINKFFIVSEVEKFEQIIQKHGFMKLNINDDGTIDIINDDVNLTLRLSLDNNFVWVKDLSSGIENCIGDVDEEKAEEFEKTLSLRIYQLAMGNIRIHKGTEPKLTPEQEQSIVNDLQEEIKKQKSSTQQKIIDLCDKIAHLLVYKNQKYGDSAIHPKNIFYKGDSENSILIRLDDKISRIINNTDGIRINDIVDIIGYLVLLLIAKNVSLYDIECLKD